MSSTSPTSTCYILHPLAAHHIPDACCIPSSTAQNWCAPMRAQIRSPPAQACPLAYQLRLSSAVHAQGCTPGTLATALQSAVQRWSSCGSCSDGRRLQRVHRAQAQRNGEQVIVLLAPGRLSYPQLPLQSHGTLATFVVKSIAQLFAQWVLQLMPQLNCTVDGTADCIAGCTDDSAVVCRVGCLDDCTARCV